MRRKKDTTITKFFAMKMSKTNEGSSTPIPQSSPNPQSSPISPRRDSNPSPQTQIPISPRRDSNPNQQQTESSRPQSSPSVNTSHPHDSSQFNSSQFNSSQFQQGLNNESNHTQEATVSTNEFGAERLTRYDVISLPQDPGKRKSIMLFHKNDRDEVRREYIRRSPCQPYKYAFPQTLMGKKMRRFNPEWFDKYKSWLEYSVEYDAAFCFPCYLFKDEISYAGGEAFVSGGFRSWNKTECFPKHVGNHKSAHNQAMQALTFFKNNKMSISSSFAKHSLQSKNSYDIRLESSIDALRYLLSQGLAFRGHDESETSLNRGNFVELLKCFGDRDENVAQAILENAPKNCQLICSDIQKDIINDFATLTTKKIIEELGDDFFAILVDESADIADKEQMSMCLRYVAKNGEVKERFLGIVNVLNTKTITLKDAIDAMLMAHSLTLSRVRGQGYDGASNMSGSINGLKTLILQEYPSAYYVHCFAHQLQLTLIAVAKKNDDCNWLFEMLAILLNVVGGSPKRKEILREKQAEHVLECLESGGLHSGTGSNQELGLSRPGDTRWSSHFKTVLHVLVLYDSIMDVLDVIGDSENDKFKVEALVRGLESFDFAFVAHLMVTIYGVTNGLNVAFQKKKIDIVAAMKLVDACKEQLLYLRNHGWDDHMEKVTSFCLKHGIDVVDMDNEESMYIPPRKSKRVRGSYQVTNLHHFKHEVFVYVLDRQLDELNDRFGEATKELLICMSCFDPQNNFSSFDPKKLVNLAKFYPNEFSIAQLMCLEYQLANFINDVRKDDMFAMVKDLNELSMKLVETKKHEVHQEVYLLLKLVLLLPVATASVERSFSAMTYVKNKLRNSMGNQLLNDCLVTFLERDLFSTIKNEEVVKDFIKKPRRMIK